MHQVARDNFCPVPAQSLVEEMQKDGYTVSASMQAKVRGRVNGS